MFGIVDASDAGATDSDADVLYALGVASLVADDPRRAIEHLRVALRRAPGMALGHAALAVALTEAPDATDAGGAQRAIAEATRLAGGGPRRQRQLVEVLALFVAGNCSRAVVLGREHLLEFGANPVVSHALERLCEPPRRDR